MNINRLILASTSRFRLALLAQAGLEVRGIAPQTDEELIQAPVPKALAQARAQAKALSLPAFPEAILAIGADQVLDFAGRPFGKAAGAEEAELRLAEFAGKPHQLHSAYSLVCYPEGGGVPQLLVNRVETATLGMRALSAAEIKSYVATGEWVGCAGCYQYENRGAHLFDWVEGDYTTIIGLPILALLKDLRSLGLDTLVHPKGPWLLA